MNPDKLQAITLDKGNSDHNNERITADNQQIKVFIKIIIKILKCQKIRALCIELYKTINKITPTL